MNEWGGVLKRQFSELWLKFLINFIESISEISNTFDGLSYLDLLGLLYRAKLGFLEKYILTRNRL